MYKRQALPPVDGVWGAGAGAEFSGSSRRTTAMPRCSKTRTKAFCRRAFRSAATRASRSEAADTEPHSAPKVSSRTSPGSSNSADPRGETRGVTAGFVVVVEEPLATRRHTPFAPPDRLVGLVMIGSGEVGHRTRWRRGRDLGGRLGHHYKTLCRTCTVMSSDLVRNLPLPTFPLVTTPGRGRRGRAPRAQHSSSRRHSPRRPCRRLRDWVP